MATIIEGSPEQFERESLGTDPANAFEVGEMFYAAGCCRRQTAM
jgi:hypothetical protein